MRVAKIVGQMDPFELIMKEFHGVFSDAVERPDEKLDNRSRIMLWMWGYQQKNDPSFKYMSEWVMNTAGNQMAKAPARSNEERGEVLLWGKAQIASMLLFVKETGRLSSLYEEMLAKQKGEEFNSDVTVE